MGLELYIPTEVGTFLPSYYLPKFLDKEVPTNLPILFCSVSRWKIRDKLREICPNLHCISKKIIAAKESLQVPRYLSTEI